jgi:hypothetical protein
MAGRSRVDGNGGRRVRHGLGRRSSPAPASNVAERVHTERHDLASTFPAGTFGLVSARFLQ